MRPSRPALSVIVPLLNEAESLPALYDGLCSVLPDDGEILFVDDGSTDESAEILERFVKSDRRVRVVRFRRNFGKSIALAAGFRRARGELVATIDADLQDDPKSIAKLADKVGEGYDVVGAWRKRRQDPAMKILVSQIFNILVSFLGGCRFRDINCGLKVIRREVLQTFPLSPGFHRFIPLLAYWRGFRTTEVEVEHHPRLHGRSRYGRTRLFRGLLDLVVILFLVRYRGRPGRYFTALGLLLGMAGFGVSAFLAYLRLATGSIQSRFPLLGLGLVLMVVGVQLFSMGLFGELMAYHFRSQLPSEPATWESGGDADEETDSSTDAVAVDVESQSESDVKERQ